VFESFIDLVLPILQERAAYKRDYTPGTYRQKLFGCGDRLPDEHPAAIARWTELGTCGPAVPRTIGPAFNRRGIAGDGTDET
jgi:hypothetical protein